MWARIHLIPLLQAEEDRDQVRRYLADQKREKELLGENMKVYHNDRYVNESFHSRVMDIIQEDYVRSMVMKCTNQVTDLCVRQWQLFPIQLPGIKQRKDSVYI